MRVKLLITATMLALALALPLAGAHADADADALNGFHRDMDAIRQRDDAELQRDLLRSEMEERRSTQDMIDGLERDRRMHDIQRELESQRDEISRLKVYGTHY